MSKKYFLETYGCQMNFAESNALEKKLKKAGWIPSESEDSADLILINTCSVRKTAENRIWGRLGYYKKKKEDSDFILGVMGCMTERLGEEIRSEFPAVDVLIGTFGKQDFIKAVEKKNIKGKENFFGFEKFVFADEHAMEGDFQAMIPIMHGCNNFCTYCIVPYVRGREVSRTPDEIINEIKASEKQGVKEVTLIGQNVNSYKYPSDEESGKTLDFPGLLKRVLEETDIPWIRFISSHPKDLSDELIELIAENKRICRHIHLPVQNGSNKILDKMNRKYTREDYLLLVDKMRKAIPDLSLTTDILIGFPGEDEEDFKLTVNLVEEVGFDDAFTYQYNAIENTAAFDFPDQVEEEVKKRRLSELIDMQRKISAERKRKIVGTTADVLVEKISRKSSREVLGRTEKNYMVVFPGNKGLIGRMYRVKMKKLSGNTFVGERKCPGD